MRNVTEEYCVVLSQGVKNSTNCVKVRAKCVKVSAKCVKICTNVKVDTMCESWREM